MKHLSYLIITILSPIICLSQSTVSGRIINQADAKPVANASVFLSSAGIAAKTGGNGTQSKHAGADSALINITSRLKTYASDHVIEKAYLHLDKPSYFFGDTIWYKAYTVVGEHHQLSALSGVLYVELIGPKDSVITRQTLHLTSGVSWGDFTLSRKLAPGNYHIRAYTNWMRNAGPEYFFNHEFTLGAPQPALITDKLSAPPNPDVQFFPEGGELVNSLRSRVAVKAVNANGLGEDINGTVEDNDGNVIADFATQHLGMGVFAMTPQSGKTYKAKINGTGGSSFTVDLPKAKEEGFTLMLNNRGKDSIYLSVAANARLFKEKQNTRFYLVAQAGGKVYYTAAGRLENPVFSATIEKVRFPSGIVQFTLFSESGEPLNERIAFIRNNDTLKLNLNSPSNTYTTRQKVVIGLDAKDDENKPTTGSFSVSVINESRLGIDQTAESTIYNNLLLTSDLKGYIEKPNYYFLNPTDQTRADLDLLMLTQGYRRFEWKNVLSNTNPPVAYQPEKLLELAGNIQTPSGKPVVNGKVTLTATRENFFADTTTDANGNFKFTNLDLPDTAKIVLNARKAHEGKNVTIFVKKADFAAVIKQKQITTSLSHELQAIMQKNYAEYRQQQKDDSLKSVRQLKEVTITARKVSKPDIYNNYGTIPEHLADMKKVNEYLSIDDALKSVIPGMFYINGHYYVGRYDSRNMVALIINDSPASEDDLHFYSPKEIDNIRLIDKTGLSQATLRIATKRYAGTDTTSTYKLKEVNIKARKIVQGPDLSGSANMNGAGHADQVITGDKLQGCITLSDCLNGKVFGVSFKDGMAYNMRSQTTLGGTPPMIIILDGNILDASHLNDVNATDISSIEVLRSAAFLTIYGSNAPGGALVITSKHGGQNSYVTSESPSGLITYPFKGFYKARAFYSPKYKGPKTETQPFDARNPVYWNPNIITDKDGKASFEYFNADTKGIYRIVIEGIDDNGNLGRQVYKYKVE
jgi:hypothetical protein